jgi:hypothetical protein
MQYVFCAVEIEFLSVIGWSFWIQTTEEDNQTNTRVYIRVRMLHLHEVGTTGSKFVASGSLGGLCLLPAQDSTNNDPLYKGIIYDKKM